MKFFSLCVLMSITPFALKAVAPSKMEREVETKDVVDYLGRPIYSSELSNPERFKEIKMEDPRDEVEFWSRQLSEHGLFFYLGIEDAALKKRGLEIHKKFEKFRKGMNDTNLSDVLPLAQELRAYKIDVAKTLDSGKWIGWTFPAFVKHVTQELDYFVDTLNAVPSSKEEELNFWNHINADHAAIEAHLFDPSEVTLTKKASNLAEKIYSLEDDDFAVFADLSLKAAKELDAFNKEGKSLSEKAQLQSVLHPVLVDHVIREGERSMQSIEALQQEQDGQDSTEIVVEEEPIS